jgi:hypothetical protein
MALVAVALACSALVAQRALSEPRAPQVQDQLGVSQVRDLKGRVVPLLADKTPTIIMINSRTCPWCKKSLRDIGQIAAGQPLPRLTVLTLEGAPYGKPMLESEGIAGARLVGPVSSAGDLQAALRQVGTPVFIAVDDRGRVLATVPGYLIYDEMKRWVAVMSGAASSP